MQTYCSSHTGIISREHTHAHELQIYYEITNPHNIKATQFIHKSKPTIWPPTNTHCSNLQSSLTHTHTQMITIGVCLSEHQCDGALIVSILVTSDLLH